MSVPSTPSASPITCYPGARIASGLLAASLATGFWAPAAEAAPPPLLIPGAENFLPAAGAPAAGPFDFLTGISRSGYLLGDIWGLRGLLAQYGISLALSETSEVLGNLTGGTRQGFEYDGLTQMALQLDTQQAFGWYGGTFRASALQIHGRNLSADNLSTLQTASGIEADPGARLWELWYQQKFLEEDRADVKIGQQSLDQEFIVSQNALIFVNTMFGWPMVPSADLPGGGPAYPLSALGVRLRARPSDSVTLLAGVFNGSPVLTNPSTLDPQQQNASGTGFSVRGGQLLIGEVQYAYPALGSMVYSAGSSSLSGTYKVGFWYDTESFNDLQYDNTGLSLANPSSTGIPATHGGNYSIYSVIDQMIWRSSEPEEADRTANVFLRAMGTPQGDRNLGRVQPQRRPQLSRADPASRRRRLWGGDGICPCQRRRVGVRPGDRVLHRGVHTGAQRRGRDRGHLPIPADAGGDRAARFPIRVQPRRGARQPEHAEPADQGRGGDRAAGQPDLLTGGPTFCPAGRPPDRRAHLLTGGTVMHAELGSNVDSGATLRIRVRIIRI